jgi:hypothetical protein
MPAGRPQKNDLNIIIKDLNIEIITIKTDEYDNEVVFAKVIDPNVKTKMKQITSLSEANDKLKVPYFVGDSGAVILKFKKKFVETLEGEELEKKKYTITAEFNYYSMTKAENEFTGYYIKVPALRRC